jgi:Putative addiction module component
VSIADIQKLPRLEKVKLMEALWADLSQDEGAVESPAWHVQELKKTEERYLAGKEEALDWAKAKDDLRKQFE